MLTENSLFLFCGGPCAAYECGDGVALPKALACARPRNNAGQAVYRCGRALGTQAMLAEGGCSWRTRSLGIALVYLLYVVAVAISLIVGAYDADAVRPALIVILTVSSLHFALGLYNRFVERRQTMYFPRLQNAVDVSDWVVAGALGAAADAVNRSAGDNRPTMFAAGILVIAAQCICAIKTYQFTNADYYDQGTGERL